MAYTPRARSCFIRVGRVHGALVEQLSLLPRDVQRPSEPGSHVRAMVRFFGCHILADAGARAQSRPNDSPRGVECARVRVHVHEHVRAQADSHMRIHIIRTGAYPA